MNDMVSIRKIRPFPSPRLGEEAGGGPGGVDFFLAGNGPSLTVNVVRQTANRQVENPVIAYDMEFSALAR
jgi:hypothetical protein